MSKQKTLIIAGNAQSKLPATDRLDLLPSVRSTVQIDNAHDKSISVDMAYSCGLVA